ncbi:MAG: fructosamine kinase family protein [Chitinophagaceae bacterium]
MTVFPFYLWGMITAGVLQYIKEQLQQFAGSTVSDCRFMPVGGGSINEAYLVQVNGTHKYFVKLNKTALFPGLFSTERNSLVLLGAQKLIRVPQVIAVASIEDQQLVLMEWIEQGGKTTSFWKNFGEQLAGLHRITNHAFGLDIDNYMGFLPQCNTLTADWNQFFEQCRLAPQVQMARDKQLLGKKQISHFERLYSRLAEIFASEPPALLHGDLWSGNYLCDEQSRPVLIDPAAYYGHRSMDMAMTTLFGGFDEVFYQSYHYHYPLPGNYRLQWEICNLYPLLVHLNLFGESYLPDILRTIERY